MNNERRWAHTILIWTTIFFYSFPRRYGCNGASMILDIFQVLTRKEIRLNVSISLSCIIFCMIFGS
jgi:hypothetical protein